MFGYVKLDKLRQIKFTDYSFERAEQDFGKPVLEFIDWLNGLPFGLQKLSTWLWLTLVDEDRALTPAKVEAIITGYMNSGWRGYRVAYLNAIGRTVLRALGRWEKEHRRLASKGGCRV